MVDLGFSKIIINRVISSKLNFQNISSATIHRHRHTSLASECPSPPTHMPDWSLGPSGPPKPLSMFPPGFPPLAFIDEATWLGVVSRLLCWNTHLCVSPVIPVLIQTSFFITSDRHIFCSVHPLELTCTIIYQEYRKDLQHVRTWYLVSWQLL